MRALSIRQPYVEQILRGTKTVEYRSRATKIIGEEFFIYAARTPGELDGFASLGCEPGDLPTGVIVGTAVIERCERIEDRGSRIDSALSSILHPRSSLFRWHLVGVKRLPRHRKPKKQPQPVWFKPF